MICRPRVLHHSQRSDADWNPSRPPVRLRTSARSSRRMRLCSLPTWRNRADFSNCIAGACENSALAVTVGPESSEQATESAPAIAAHAKPSRPSTCVFTFVSSYGCRLRTHHHSIASSRHHRKGGWMRATVTAPTRVEMMERLIAASAQTSLANLHAAFRAGSTRSMPLAGMSPYLMTIRMRRLRQCLRQTRGGMRRCRLVWRGIGAAGRALRGRC
jgi:hypothetical protein